MELPKQPLSEVEEKTAYTEVCNVELQQNVFLCRSRDITESFRLVTLLMSIDLWSILVFTFVFLSYGSMYLVAGLPSTGAQPIGDRSFFEKKQLRLGNSLAKR